MSFGLTVALMASEVRMNERLPIRSSERSKPMSKRSRRSLTAAEQRAEKQAAEFAAREARHAADLAVERTLADRMSARVDQMTADLAVEQAQRVDAEKRLAAELARGWFRRRPRLNPANNSEP